MKTQNYVKTLFVLISFSCNISYCSEPNAEDFEQKKRTIRSMQVGNAPASSPMCKQIKRATLAGLLTAIAMDGAAIYGVPASISGVAASNLSITDRLLAIGKVPLAIGAVPLTFLVLAPLTGMYSFYQGLRYGRYLI